MAEITMTTKMVVVGGAALGGAVPPILDSFVDTSLAAAAVKRGDIVAPEAYPFYKRTGVVIPLATGIPALIAGIIGDKYIVNKDLQLGLLIYGASATTGGLVNLLRGLQARRAAGMSMVFPDSKSVPKNTVLQRAPTYILPPATPADTARLLAAQQAAAQAQAPTGLTATFV